MPSPTATTTSDTTARLAALDHAHVWHPFTPMRQWRETEPMIIDRAEGSYLFDTQGRRYIDGVSSLWCNVHGHRVAAIDDAVRAQLDKVAHSTLLGLGSPPSIEFAAMLCERLHRAFPGAARPLNKVFYSDAGATALEVAFKMAVGYWFHKGKPAKRKFIGLAEAYHGDTVGAMSVGYSELFHKPFLSMVFEVMSVPNPDPCRPPAAVREAVSRPDAGCSACVGEAEACGRVWPSQCPALQAALREHCLAALRRKLEEHADETAAIVVEPLMQGAAGMICQPPGFVAGLRALADEFDVLLIADEVAVGFGRTGKLFACEHELARGSEGATAAGVDPSTGPDIMCLAKGISGGYLPLAATVCTDAIDEAFTGELSDRRTLYHGHTYTGNALACAAAVASLNLFDAPPAGSDQPDLLSHTQASARIIGERLEPLRDHPHVLDIRRRGLMTGIELCQRRPGPGQPALPFDFAARTGAQVCAAARQRGVIVRPLGDVMILMPIPATPHDVLIELCDSVVQTIEGWRFEG